MTAAEGGVCRECGEALPTGARFCPGCGTTTATDTCGACGEQLTPQARFCPGCGAPVSTGVSSPAAPAAGPVSERRVTSVLFGDLVGFTPLSESRDPEEVRELLSRYFAECRTVVGRYGGTVEKFIGDAVMAVWGVPVAHEDDAERAVRAGMELTETLAALGDEVGASGLAMRVGVVTGEVAVTIGATSEGMVAGDAVNTASRVQSVAAPGQVWVDETTRTLTVASIAYQDAGEHTLKGKAEPLALYSARAVVADVGGGQRVDGLEAPFVGRERELRLVKELFHATEESARPRLVVVDGEPGVGKSRLAWEFEKYVDGLSATVRWHRGRCLSYGEGVAFWALGEALRPRLGLVETDAGDVVTDRLDTSLEALVPDPEERDWLRPRLSALVGAGHAGGFAREDLFAAWTAFLERIGAGEHVVVLVIDDAQHADSGLLDFLDYLTTSAHSAIFVLALARPELLARRHDLGGRRATVLRLDPLEDAAMTRLVDGLVDGLPDETCAALVGRSEGIPLFAVETVRALIDRDAVVPSGGRYVPADGVQVDLEAIGAPASLQALVAARLDALSAEERAVVADACVLGTSFTLSGLAAVGGDAGDLETVLASLQRKEIVEIQQDRFSAERGQYRFVQAVVRQVAYATLARRDRKARHLAAADHLSRQLDEADELAVVIAQHLLDAVDASAATDPDIPELTARARDLMTRAGARASSLGAHQEARRLYESALARADQVADRAVLQLATARAADDAGDFGDAAAHAKQATDLFDQLGMPIDAGVAAALHGRCLNALQDNAGGIEIARPRWLALEGVPGAERALILLAQTLGSAYAAHGDMATMAEYAQRRVLMAEAAEDWGQLAQAHLQLGIRYQAEGAPVTSIALIESAASLARENGLGALLARSLNNLAATQASRDLAAALESAFEATEAARRAGMANELDYTTANYLLVVWMAGRLEELEQGLRTFRESVRLPGMVTLIDALECWRADAVGGSYPEPDLSESTDHEGELAWAGTVEIALAAAAGDRNRAARLAEQSLPHVLAANGLDDDFVHLWPPIVLAALRAGDLELAERMLEPVVAAPPGVISPAVNAQFHRLRGLLAAARGDDAEAVEADLRAGAAMLADFGAVLLAARAQEELGDWLIEQGRADEGEELVGRARATYEQAGAVGWLAARADSPA
jgi:class 3 adenylate cyclase/tetratricopeptide (TPR) repeat protein